MSEAAKAARERRRAKINAAGTDRLAKITGSNRFKDVEAPKRATQSHPESAHSEVQSAPGSSLFSPESTPGTASGAQEAAFADDPLFKLLSQMVGQAPQAGGASLGTGDDPAAGLLAMLQQQSGGADQPNGSDPMGLFSALGQPPAGQEDVRAAPVVAAPSTGNYWKFAHIIVAIAVAFYVSSHQFKAGVVFLTAQICLVSARMVLDKTPRRSVIAAFMPYIPAQFRRQVKIASTLYAGLHDAYRDLCLAIFVYALIHLQESTGGTGIHTRLNL